jgi:hypothetical protein
MAENPIRINGMPITEDLVEDLPKRSALDCQAGELIGTPWCQVVTPLYPADSEYVQLLWKQGDELFLDLIAPPLPGDEEAVAALAREIEHRKNQLGKLCLALWVTAWLADPDKRDLIDVHPSRGATGRPLFCYQTPWGWVGCAHVDGDTPAWQSYRRLYEAMAIAFNDPSAEGAVATALAEHVAAIDYADKTAAGDLDYHLTVERTFLVLAADDLSRSKPEYERLYEAVTKDLELCYIGI